MKKKLCEYCEYNDIFEPIITDEMEVLQEEKNEIESNEFFLSLIGTEGEKEESVREFEVKVSHQNHL